MARYEVHDTGEGITAMPARVIQRAVDQRLSTLRGVRKVRTTVAGREARVAVVPEHEHDVDDLRDRINVALGLDFWIDLGMADITYSVKIEKSGRRI
jgi:hypothetical protein